MYQKTLEELLVWYHCKESNFAENWISIYSIIGYLQHSKQVPRHSNTFCQCKLKAMIVVEITKKYIAKSFSCMVFIFYFPFLLNVMLLRSTKLCRKLCICHQNGRVFVTFKTVHPPFGPTSYHISCKQFPKHQAASRHQKKLKPHLTAES